MRDPVRVLMVVRHAMGVALLVPWWPSRQKIRRLEADCARLRRVAILGSVEAPVVVENRRLRSSVTEAADILVAALEEPATQDDREGLRLVR